MTPAELEQRSEFVRYLLSRGQAVECVRIAGVAWGTCSATPAEARWIELGSRAAYYREGDR